MPLTPGARLGPYEILAPIGAGGMGEVFKARDIRLDRTVAIKILPALLTSEPGSRQRLEREARAIAALQHPHVCTIHDIGHEAGTDFLVMEFLEGETLAARLRRGRLSAAQSLEYGTQIAEGLAAAHRAGIIHRDLKPGNIMLTRDGAKLLDFGLAKPVASALLAAGSDATTEAPITAKGIVVGTLEYMAPEQLEGREVDARTDMFAFGAVFYEMLTGRRAFRGDTASAVATAILALDPAPVDNAETPPVVHELLRACLAKNPDERWQSAGDLARALRWNGRSSGRLASTRRGWTLAIGAGTVAGLLVAIGVIIWSGRPSRSTAAAPAGRFEIPIANELTLLDPPIISADGQRIAYAAFRADGRSQLFLRGVDELDTKPLPGTEDARFPFFAPDGRSIAFFGDGGLKAVSLVDGTVTDVVGGLGRWPGVAMGGSWSASQGIVFSPRASGVLQSVSRPGGAVSTYTTLDVPGGEGTHRWPQHLPDGRGVLFTSNSRNNIEPFKICLQVPGEPAHRDVMDGARAAKYVAGHLLFARGTSLFVVPFDLRSRQVTGTARPLLDGVLGTHEAGESFFAVSPAGTLAYAEGADVKFVATPLLVDAKDTVHALPNAPSATFLDPTVSPDGNRAIITTFTNGSQDLWLYDLSREIWTRLTRSVQPRMAPVWLDGESFVFSAEASGKIDLWRGAADGSREPELLIHSDHTKYAMSWSAATRLLAYVEVVSGGTEEDIWLADLSGPVKTEAVLATGFRESAPDLSPDGQWLAYESDESGRNEIYVKPVRRGGKLQISTAGGRWPRWSREGRQLLYVNVDQLMTVAITVSQGTIRTSQPALRLKYSYFGGSSPNYAMLSDNRLLIVRAEPRPSPPRRLIVVQNWLSQLGGAPPPQ